MHSKYTAKRQEEFESTFGPRPTMPDRTDVDPHVWYQIAEWERMRANFFQALHIRDDLEYATGWATA
jgi:hypothetical protein